jgi:lysine N6-hydroxylase
VQERQSVDHFEVVGAGLGPFNLSLAALLEPLADVRARFFEARESFAWHCGIMVPGAMLQVSFLKDLVTLVDPTSRFSFLNYLAQHGRLYRFLTAHTDRCSRREFELYYQWAAGQLESVRWDHPVDRIDLTERGLAVSCRGAAPVTATNLVLGSGREPWMPEFAMTLRGRTVLHSADLQTVAPETRGRDVLVIGAGQSGAEVVNHLLEGEHDLPRSLTWISSRMGLLPLDDSPFTNEWFHPPYVDHFYGLPEPRRAHLLSRQRMASDGVSESLLNTIYRRLYELDTVQPGRLRHRLLVCRRVIDLFRVDARPDARLIATVHDEDTGAIENCDVDVVICATGYRAWIPDYLEPLHGRIVGSDGRLRVRRDYSLEWDGPPGLAIYIQNGAESTHGIADPNLSLAAWRSATIINSICGRTAYHIDGESSSISWNGQRAAALPREAETLSTPDIAEVNAR